MPLTRLSTEHNPWFWRQRWIRALARFLVRYAFGVEGKRLVKGLRLFYRLRIEVVLQAESIGRLAHRRELRVWVDGDEAFPRIERLFRRARHTIIIQMFIWKDDSTGRHIAGLLVEAANRGVNVHITKEVVGDVFELHQDFLGTQQSDDTLWRQFWHHPRIHVTYEKHNDHTKVYVIDDEILLLGGMNIADTYRYSWHDYLVELRGSVHVRQYLTREHPPPSTIRLVMNTESAKEIRPVLVRLITSARHTIVVEHCYFSDPEIITLLARRSHEGVRIVVILPDRTDVYHHANLQGVAQLLSEAQRTNLQVLLFPGIVHGKIILVDRTRVFLGSANLMRSSLDEMGEVNVLLDGVRGRDVQKIRDTLRLDILRSKPLANAPALWWMTKVLAWMGL